MMNPKGSDIYSRLKKNYYSTPMGSNCFDNKPLYKHTIPLGLKTKLSKVKPKYFQVYDT